MDRHTCIHTRAFARVFQGRYTSHIDLSDARLVLCSFAGLGKLSEARKTSGRKGEKEREKVAGGTHTTGAALSHLFIHQLIRATQH